MTFRLATRLNSFRLQAGQKRSSAEALRAVARVDGISAVELNYPQHFVGEAEDLLQVAKDNGLAVTALNLRYDGPDFAHGAFTHPNPANRAKAIAISRDAVVKAAEAGIGHVILWMGPDGYDYPFQCDYRRLWEMEIDGFRQVAEASETVRVSVEYKPNEPRRFSLIRNMGEALLAVADVNRANFGVTLDYCHLLMSLENPALAASLALARGKLFGVHINDGYGTADDGLIVGTVTPLQTIELLGVLQKAGFDGTIYFDTFPDRLDPAGECAANVGAMRRLERLAAGLPAVALAEAQARQDAITATRLVQEAVFR
jgi:xylose isomerase